MWRVPMMWGGYDGWGAMGWMMAANTVTWLALLAAGAVLVYRFARPTSPVQSKTRSSGLGILEDRYARGEIGRDEYLEKKQDLQGSAS